MTAVLLAGCSESPAQIHYNPHPQTPVILRDTAMVNDQNEWTRPYIPGLRTTTDGRIGLRTQGGPDTFSFWLLVPEKLDEPILPGRSGPRMLASPDPITVTWPPAEEEGLQRVGHHAICDPTTEFPQEEERPNPYACGDTGGHDCYDITIISSTAPGFRIQMWGTPVTVEVANPKTAEAHIVRVELGEPVEGARVDGSLEWAEAAITADGRLLTGRWGSAQRPWTHPHTGEEFSRMYDIGYSVLPEESAPCDVTGWTEFHPMSHAPYDPEMIGRYGLAAYPFRDSEGRIIEDGEDIGGSYPWVDREGANVFMTGVPGKISEQSEDAYPRRCVVDGCESFEEPEDWDRGFLVAGLWTHGKFVHLDGMINNQDWAVGLRPDSHWMVDLYQDEEGTPEPVRFGAGRGNAGTHPPAFPGNENILDSLQNLPNFVPAARPVTPRDVVWVMSTGVATEEIAFDDFLDPRAFIVSNMQASVTQMRNEYGETMNIPIHWNGQRYTIPQVFLPIAQEIPHSLDADAVEDIHIQNAATSLELAIPEYGLVEAGTGRVEPVALGGFYGRGFWLDGENRIRYAVPPQGEAAESDWYVGLFIDPRTSDGNARTVFTFPDGTGIRLVDRDRVQYVADRRVIHEVALPGVSETGWLHLGWHVRSGHRELVLLVNGLAVDRFDAGRPLFRAVEGDLIVGHAERAPGVRAWIDDFKVLAHAVGPEVACNHAGGTLIEVGDVAAWVEVADRYPTWAHAEVAGAAGRADGRFACFHDYRADYAAHLQNIPEGAESLRDAITFPEGPLQAGAPRPDSSGNGFCLSCHTAESQGALGLDALAFRSDVVLEDDPRRQPAQPPRRVFGNIPGGWIPAEHGPGSPAEAMVAPSGGILIDRWVLPSAN